MKLIAKPVKVFTRDDPCTKVDLWNCFAIPGGFRRRAVIEARGEIGINAIKYLTREGYAKVRHDGQVDYWELTPAGIDWLVKGTARFIQLNPTRERELLVPLNSGKPARRRVSRPA